MGNGRIKTVGRWLLVAYLLSMLGAAVLVQLVADRSPLGMLVLYAPRHLLLLPWIVLLPIAVAISRTAAVGALLGISITLFGVAGFEFPVSLLTPTAVTANSARLRVVTYNTDVSVALGGRIADDLGRWDADAVALLDCAPQLAATLRSLKTLTVVVDRSFCFVTPHTITSHERMPAGFLKAQLAVPGALRSDRAGRVHRFDLRVRGRPVTVYMLHFASPRIALLAARGGDVSRLALNAARRASDSRIASAWVDRRSPGLIVMGDFNLTPESVVLERDWSDLTNAFTHAGFGLGRTMFAGWHRVRIDHVYTGPDLEAISARVERGYPSEHQPLIVELR